MHVRWCSAARARCWRAWHHPLPATALVAHSSVAWRCSALAVCRTASLVCALPAAWRAAGSTHARSPAKCVLGAHASPQSPQRGASGPLAVQRLRGWQLSSQAEAGDLRASRLLALRLLSSSLPPAPLRCPHPQLAVDVTAVQSGSAGAVSRALTRQHRPRHSDGRHSPCGRLNVPEKLQSYALPTEL